MTATTHPAGPQLTSAAVQGSTKMLVRTGRAVNPDLPPIIFLNGWPGTDGWDPTPGGWSLNAVLAAGYTVITPWTGANWGHVSASSPSLAGAGTGAITDAVACAATLGLPTTKVHLYGTSMGGLNALAWAKANLSAVGGIYLVAPVSSLAHIWDISATAIPAGGTYPDYKVSMAAAWGTTAGDRTAFLAATSGIDPERNAASLDDLGARISIYGARDDDVVGWDELEAFATATGATLKASSAEGVAGGGHVFLTLLDAYSEYDALAHFADHAA